MPEFYIIDTGALLPFGSFFLASILRFSYFVPPPPPLEERIIWKLSGTLLFREIALVDKVRPSFYFQTEQFIVRATVLQEAERLVVVVSCTNALESIL